MSWRDAEGGWSKAMTRRARWFGYVAASIFGAAGLGAAACVVFLGFEYGVLLGAIVMVIMSISGVTTHSARRRIHRLIRTVRAADGRVCPRCRRASNDEAGRIVCPRHGDVGSTEGVLDFWTAYPFRKASESSIARQDVDRAGVMIERHRAGEEVGILIAALGAGVFIFILFVLGRTDMLSAVPFMLGLVFAGYAVAHRRTALSCARCGYEKATAGASARCPECAAEWNAPGGAVRDRTHRRPWLIGASVLCFAVWAGPMLIELTTGRNVIVRLRTTDGLIETVGTVDDLTTEVYREWNELDARTLTTAQESRLIDLLLDTMQRPSAVRYQAEQWLQARSGTKAMSPQQQERYDALTEADGAP